MINTKHPESMDQKKKSTMKSKKSKEETWKLHDNYSFELCPEGNGLDTHRFYEALLLNTIPIVKRNSLESMYIQFPCVIVDDWKEITKERNGRLIALNKISTMN